MIFNFYSNLLTQTTLKFGIQLYIKELRVYTRISIFLFV